MAPWGNFNKFLNCHNSGCMQDRVVIFGSMVGFSGNPTNPRCSYAWGSLWTPHA